ncbi:AEC family transporter [Calothrix sp. 336/3]|uniref:AEC family transporter n=1 Tax=Calothrix sp. 336/3 TaxID=1337936 RepID=UPI0004E445BE
MLELYAKLLGFICTGFILGRVLPGTFPTRLGQVLFWVGVPISIIAFLRHTDLSGQIWIAPLVAYSATFLGILLAKLALKIQGRDGNLSQPATQGSFILASMVGNTGYLGFPITLTVVGKEYFAWALFYDMLGSLFAAYGLGVILAARFGNGTVSWGQTLRVILINPALWSFFGGLWFQQVAIPPTMELILEALAWLAIASALLLIGMRLSRLTSWQSLPQASVSVAIKMLVVPLILSTCLRLLGLRGAIATVMTLQMGMPPAFATLVLAETFNLDRDLAVTTLALGTVLLLFTLPLWLWLF